MTTLRIVRAVAAVVAFLGFTFIIGNVVSKVGGVGWSIATIPFDILGGFAAGSFGSSEVMAALRADR